MSNDDPDTSQLEGGLYAYGGQSVIIWASLFIILCTLFVALRFISLRVGRRAIGLEDWLILPALIIEVGLCVNGICSMSKKREKLRTVADRHDSRCSLRRRRTT